VIGDSSQPKDVKGKQGHHGKSDTDGQVCRVGQERAAVEEEAGAAGVRGVSEEEEEVHPCGGGGRGGKRSEGEEEEDFQGV
jgi:hypothetical protein